MPRYKFSPGEWTAEKERKDNLIIFPIKMPANKLPPTALPQGK